jgi:hypothetical protein
MLLASNIGFLALVAPAQLFYALTFDPQRGMQSTGEYKSFIIQGSIYQCLINTYYAASFVFCFASSSMFRREIKKLLQKRHQPKHGMDRAISGGPNSSHENHPFIQQGPSNGVTGLSSSRTNEHVLEITNAKRATQSTIEDDS